MALDVTLITGRTIYQGEAIETGKDLELYTKAAGICEFDPSDMAKLGVNENDTVRVSTERGAVSVRAVKSRQYPHEAIVFIPMGPWANYLTGHDTNSTGMPSFKGIPAKVEAARGEKVLGARELMRTLYAEQLKVKNARP
ncbi:MAG: molybdopterin dinucleotide-binding protein [Euryarchaeota archaeon]|nr:molybdopterin dinucleotide-binding protein [Euryarchaeota archaeon]